MWLIAMKGPPGSGKSTLARSLSEELACPLIDKDDIRDLLTGDEMIAGGLSYDIMFQIAYRQLLQGLSVVCDSPLTSNMGYQRAQTIAAETDASLVILECVCKDEAQWQERIHDRKARLLPAHRQTDWSALQDYLDYYYSEANYPITDQHLVINTTRPPGDCVDEILYWLEQVKFISQTE